MKNTMLCLLILISTTLIVQKGSARAGYQTSFDYQMEDSISYRIDRYAITPSEKKIQMEVHYEETDYFEDEKGEQHRFNVWLSKYIDVEGVDYDSTALIFYGANIFFKEQLEQYLGTKINDQNLIDVTALEKDSKIKAQLGSADFNDLAILLPSDADMESLIIISRNIYTDKNNIYDVSNLNIVPIKELGMRVLVYKEDK